MLLIPSFERYGMLCNIPLRSIKCYLWIIQLDMGGYIKSNNYVSLPLNIILLSLRRHMLPPMLAILGL
jgi:hypothetical protein